MVWKQKFSLNTDKYYYSTNCLLYWNVTTQKMKFSTKDFFSKCDQICRKLETADLVTFTEDILNGKIHFFAVGFWQMQENFGQDKIPVLLKSSNVMIMNGLWWMVDWQKHIKLKVQQRPLPLVLTIASLWHTASWIWTCIKFKFKLCWMNLRYGDYQYINI